MRQHHRLDEETDAAEARGVRGATAPPLPMPYPFERGVSNGALSRYLRSGAGRRPSRVREAAVGETDYQEKLARYQELEKKGRLYYANMIAAVNNAEAVDKNSKAQFDERYATTSKPNSEVPSNVTTNVKDPSAYTLVETGVKGQGSAYKNYVNAAEGTFVASWNYAEEDKGGAGTRLQHSEIIYRQYTEFGGPLKDLTTVVRSSIQGKAANEIIDMCKGKKAQKFGGITYTPDNDDFYALLATDNGKAIAFMLTDHPVESGRKAVTSVKMYLDRLVFTLGQP